MQFWHNETSIAKLQMIQISTKTNKNTFKLTNTVQLS